MNPTALTKKEAKELTEETVTQVKRLDCALYNTCLDMAYQKGWPQFGCQNCKAHQAMTVEEKVQDHVALRVLNQALDNLVQIGKIDRKRGARGNNR